MNRKMGFLGLLALCSVFALEARAQQQPYRQKVFFECTCKDPVGALFATSFRDLLATSPRYAEANEAAERDASGKVKALNWHVVVISIDPSDAQNGRNTAISMVFLLGKDTYLLNRIETFGRSYAQDAARAALAALDNEIQEESR